MESHSVAYSEEDEDGFVKKVKKCFGDGGDTLVFVQDNFDGNSTKVAELLFKNGFKEAYAIKRVVGNTGKPIATFCPHDQKEKAKASQKFGTNGGVVQQNRDSEAVPFSKSSSGEAQASRLHVDASSDTEPQLKTRSRSSSPYPNYPDLKPPSTPTPSKPGK